MSLVKELSIKDGKLYQYPVEAITSLRTRQEDFSEKRQQLTLTSLNLTSKLTLKQNLSSSQTKKEMAYHLPLILQKEKLSLTVLKLANSTLQTLAQVVNALLMPDKLQQQTSLWITQLLKFSSIKVRKSSLAASSQVLNKLVSK